MNNGFIFALPLKERMFFEKIEKIEKPACIHGILI